MMWLLFILGWLGFLAVTTIFALQAFGYDFNQLLAVFHSMPATQRMAIGAIAFLSLSLIGAALFQAIKISRQDRSVKSLRERLKGLRQDLVVAHALQSHLDATVQHLVDSDPDQAIASLKTQLADTEQRAVSQHSRDESTDIHDQVSDIRRRQQSLREIVGGVAERRRTMEPVFAELRDRQRQLERSLGEIEVDDSKNSLALRLKEMDTDVTGILARLNIIQESFASLNRFKDNLDKSRAELVPMRSPESGIGVLIAQLRVGRDELAKALDELESHEGEPLVSRVEMLSRNKIEIEQRVARLSDGFNILNAIRLDLEELGQRQSQMKRSLAEVETDANGKSLVDRQNVLNEFVVECRLRLSALQETSATLNRFKEELSKSQADLVPLQAPVFGIEALIGEVNRIRDLVIKTLGEIEANGDDKLTARMEAISRSKREVEERTASVLEHFATLDSIRKDVSGIFTAIRGALNRIG